MKQKTTIKKKTVEPKSVPYFNTAMALANLTRAEEELFCCAFGFSICQKRKLEHEITRITLSLFDELNLEQESANDPKREAKKWLKDSLIKYKNEFSYTNN